jgi:hypothetical protein
MLAIVDDDHTLVQCFENAGHLLQPFGLFEFQRKTPAHPRAAWMFILPNLAETHKATCPAASYRLETAT